MSSGVQFDGKMFVLIIKKCSYHVSQNDARAGGCSLPYAMC